MAKDTLRLDKAVAHNFDVPRNYAAKIIKSGLVSVNDEVITDPSCKISIDSDIVLDGNEVSAKDGFKSVCLCLTNHQDMSVQTEIIIIL